MTNKRRSKKNNSVTPRIPSNKMSQAAFVIPFNDIKKKIDESNESQRFIGTIHRRNKKNPS